jgi:hypothetical protein
VREALLGAARAGERPEAAPFLPALGRLVPDWATDAGAAVDTTPVVLAEGLLRVLAGLARPGAAAVLVVEDLHWADRETPAVVQYLADNVAGHPVLEVATLRAGEPGVDGACFRFRHALTGDAIVHGLLPGERRAMAAQAQAGARAAAAG